MTIATSTISDLDSIFELYSMATAYQRTKFDGNIWPEFSRAMVEKEIAENRQFKILEEQDIACIWAITFDDEKIWEEKNLDPSIYIHRIATYPLYRGRNYVKHIVEWAKAYANEHQKHYIRLDTCGMNTGLIAYYESCGFSFLGSHKLKDSRELPAHYRDADVCFFEIALRD